MPRMNITDEEAELLRRRRTVARIRTQGWNDALAEVEKWVRLQTEARATLSNEDMVAYLRTCAKPLEPR